MNPFPSIQGYLLDLDGTCYRGDKLIDGAIQFIEQLYRQRKKFLFVTNNSSKNRRDYAEKLTRLGLPVSEHTVLTSGEATALFMRRVYPDARLFVVGTPSLEVEFSSRGFRLDSPDPQAIVLGFDTSLTYAKLWRLCDLVRSGLPYIATHPDINCPTEDGFMPDIGSVIAFVKASTGCEPDCVIGKPNRAIVETASDKLGVPIEHLAMVGDRLYTDIALGQATGLVTALVLSGETQMEDVEKSPYQPDLVVENLGMLAILAANNFLPSTNASTA